MKYTSYDYGADQPVKILEFKWGQYQVVGKSGIPYGQFTHMILPMKLNDILMHNEKKAE